MNPRNLTREYIEQLNDIEPYCFETDGEEQWFNIGLQYGLDVADSDPKSPWISVEDDLPCNPKYLKQEGLSPWVIAITEEGEIFFAQMMLMRGEWVWHSHFSREHKNICYWMTISIPERFEHTWEIKL